VGVPEPDVSQTPNINARKQTTNHPSNNTVICWGRWKCGSGKCRSGKCRSRLQGWKMQEQ